MSSEFPTFVPEEGGDTSELLTRFVVHALNSPQYLERVDAQSTGSTKQSRNRFRQELFVDFPVEIPASATALEELVGLLDNAAALRRRQHDLALAVTNLREEVSLSLPLPGSG